MSPQLTREGSLSLFLSLPSLLLFSLFYLGYTKGTPAKWNQVQKGEQQRTMNQFCLPLSSPGLLAFSAHSQCSLFSSLKKGKGHCLLSMCVSVAKNTQFGNEMQFLLLWAPFNKKVDKRHELESCFTNCIRFRLICNNLSFEQLNLAFNLYVQFVFSFVIKEIRVKRIDCMGLYPSPHVASSASFFTIDNKSL